MELLTVQELYRGQFWREKSCNCIYYCLISFFSFWETVKIGHGGASRWAACHQMRKYTNLHIIYFCKLMFFSLKIYQQKAIKENLLNVSFDIWYIFFYCFLWIDFQWKEHYFTKYINCRFVYIFIWWQAAHLEAPPCPFFTVSQNVVIWKKGQCQAVV